ncbi:Vacuolar protein sorting-associated protein 8, partial [Kappamyces sp. JEL0680]
HGESWSAAQMDALYSFIGRSYSQFPAFLPLSQEQLMEVFNALLSSEWGPSNSERQNAVLALLSAGFVPHRAEADRELYLEKFEKASFWKVYERYVLQDFRFDLAILSYLRDPTRKQDVYETIQNWLWTMYPDHVRKIKLAVEMFLLDLVGDGAQLSRIYTTFWNDDHQHVVAQLSPQPPLQLKYVEGLLNPSRRQNNVQQHPPLPAELYELYFRLLCLQRPASVRGYLEQCHKHFTTLPFRVDYVLQLAKEHGIVDAQIWILVEKKDYTGALHLLLDSVALAPLLAADATSLDCSANAGIDQAVDQAIDICRKATKNRDELWNILLDKIVFQPTHASKAAADVQHRVVTAAIAHISIPNILIRLLEQQGDQPISQFR